MASKTQHWGILSVFLLKAEQQSPNEHNCFLNLCLQFSFDTCIWEMFKLLDQNMAEQWTNAKLVSKHFPNTQSCMFVLITLDWLDWPTGMKWKTWPIWSLLSLSGPGIRGGVVSHICYLLTSKGHLFFPHFYTIAIWIRDSLWPPLPEKKTYLAPTTCYFILPSHSNNNSFKAGSWWTNTQWNNGIQTLILITFSLGMP